MRAAFVYEGGVKSWILDIKENLKAERCRELEEEHLPQRPEAIDCLIPVTSDPEQTRRRLFEPAELLANRLSEIWRIPVLSNLFQRKFFIKPLKELSREKRLEYLRKLVDWRSVEAPEQIRGARVLLIDDVMTSGATLKTHARLLKPYSQRLDVFCLARALKPFA